MLDVTRWVGACLALTTTLFALDSAAAAQASRALAREPPPDLPASLAPWLAWVRSDDEQLSCPVREGRALCFWPGPLALTLDQRSGGFRFDLLLDRKLMVHLPGGPGRWPLNVRVDGRPAAVVSHADTPSLELPAGTHRIEGAFAWPRLPDSLPVPPEYGQLAVRLAGQPVARPKRDEGGSLWLQAAGAQGEQAQLELIVHRKLQDSVPLRVETRIRLRAAGEPREVSLGKVLLAGTRAMSIDSPLPVRLDPDGELRAQLRAGSYELRVLARSVGLPTEVSSEPRPAPWPAQEVWVFAPDEALRQVRVSGAPSVDPARFDLDADLRGLPAFLVSQTDKLTLAVQRRGEPEPAPNQLTLERQLWLDQSGRGYSVRDRLSGELHQGFRLELTEGALGRVSQAGEDQLVTQRKADGPSGVELRDVRVALEADSRLASPKGALPAVGWSEDVRALAITLHMPPGYALWAVSGADSVDRSWLGDWELFGLFFVLVVAFGTGSVVGRWAGLLALVTLGLTYHEPDAPSGVWLALLATAALSRFVKPGTFAKLVRVAFGVSLLVLALQLVPFAARSLREAMYPQLASQMGPSGDASYTEQAQFAGGAVESTSLDDRAEEAEAALVQQAAAPSAPPMEGADKRMEQAAVEVPAPDGAPRRQGIKTGDAYSAYGSGPTVRYKRLAQDPEAIVQTGPGLPDWQFRSWRLSWSGPVAHDHRFELWILPPLANRLLALLRVVACALLAFWIVRASRSSPPGGAGRRDAGKGTPSGGPAKSAAPQPAASATGASISDAPSGAFKRAALGESPESKPTADGGDKSGVNAFVRGLFSLVACAWLLGAPLPVRAQFPDQQLLSQLRERALRPPPCRPECVSVSELSVRIGPAGLTLRAEVHAQDHTSVRVPGPLALWAPEQVRLGYVDARMIALEDGFLHVRVAPGVQVLEVSGPLPPSDTLNLRLGDRPARVQVVSDGYEVRGVRADGTAEDSIEIRRILHEEREAASVTLPPWFSLTRTLELGSEFRVHNVLERETPVGSAALVRLPLLAAESVQDARVQVDGKNALITFGPDDTRFEFDSSLPQSAQLELVAASGASYSERWQLRCGSMWQCTTQGLTPVSHEAAGQWQPLFRPWPGERLRIAAVKPAAAPGQSTTIDAAKLIVRPGVRATDAELQVSLRTSRGGIQRLTLPAGASVRSFSVNGERRPLQRDGAAHSFSVLPGRANLALSFELSSGVSSWLTVPRVELGTAAKNARVVVELPPDRWLLWLRGPSWGPAILFWGYFALVVLAALVLGRVSRGVRSSEPAARLPLSTLHWLLLGLGLTQVDAFEALAVVLFFFALAYRARTRELAWWKHDFMQLALAVWAFVFVGTLFNAVQHGLLVQPDMQVTGAGSHQGSLQWYVDSAGTTLPTPTVISVPLWSYRVLMLLWSLWLARQVVLWAPWAFRAFSSGGAWKHRPPRAPPAKPPSPPLASPPAAPSGSGGA